VIFLINSKFRLLGRSGLGSFLCLTLESLQRTRRDLNGLGLAIDEHMNLLQIDIPLTAGRTK